MAANDKYVGLFWSVYEQLYGPKVVFDSDLAVKEGDYIKIGTTFEESWPLFRESNDLPNKPFDHYPHGEVVFDTKLCKFKVIGTPKLVHNTTMQNKVIRMFKLPRFVVFTEFPECES